MDLVRAGFLEFDDRGNLVAYSENARTLFGFDPSDVETIWDARSRLVDGDGRPLADGHRPIRDAIEGRGHLTDEVFGLRVGVGLDLTGPASWAGVTADPDGIVWMRISSTDVPVDGSAHTMIGAVNISDLRRREIELTEALSALDASEERYRRIVEHANEGVWCLDANGVTTFVNQRLAAMLGSDPDELIGTSHADHVHPDDLQGPADLPGWLGVSEPWRGEVRYVRADGRTVQARVSVAAVTAAGENAGSVALVTDITNEVELQRELAAAERRFEAIFDHSTEIITVLAEDGSWLYSSPAGTRILGHPRGADPEGGVFAFVHPDDRAEAHRRFAEVAAGNPVINFVCRLMTSTGEWRWFESSATNLVDDDAIAGVLVMSHDVTEREQLQARLAHAARMDDLTGLLNRRAFTEGLEAALSRSARAGAHVGLVFVDIDDLKIVNDTHGHAAGDQVLVAAAERLRSGVRAGDLAGRLGGDEFVVAFEGLSGREGLAARARALARVLDEPVALGGTVGTLACSASIGAALSRPGEDVGALLSRADRALYTAKRTGKGRLAMEGDAGA